jgi:hypothetical protein
MAKHRALAEALSIVFLGAGSAMFACRGPSAADPFEPIADAGEDTSVSNARADASGDATAAVDGRAAADAHAMAPDAQAYSYPLSRCSVDQDVFYIDVEGPAGPLQLGEITKTEAGTYWFVELQPELNVMLATENGPVGDVQVWTPDSTPVIPGTYPQGPSSTGPTIDVAVVKEGCHLTSGTFTLVDLEYTWPDGSTSGDVTSLLLSFDLVCGSNTLRGCVRYSR